MQTRQLYPGLIQGRPLVRAIGESDLVCISPTPTASAGVNSTILGSLARTSWVVRRVATVFEEVKSDFNMARTDRAHGRPIGKKTSSFSNAKILNMQADDPRRQPPTIWFERFCTNQRKGRVERARAHLLKTEAWKDQESSVPTRGDHQGCRLYDAVVCQTS